MALREVTQDDLPIFFEHQREPEANRMAATPPRDQVAFLKHWHEKVLGIPTNCVRTIVVDGKVAGNLGSFERDGRRLVGYWIGSAWWGRGVASAALFEFLAQHEKSRPLHAHVAVSNLASVRVLEKCGFRQIGGVITAPDGVDEILMELR